MQNAIHYMNQHVISGKEETMKPEVLFTYVSKESYPEISYKNINLTEVLTRAKNRMNNNNKFITWDGFKKRNSQNIQLHDIVEKKAAYKKDADIFINKDVQKEFENDNEILRKEYKNFLPTLKYELKEYLRKLKSSDKFEECYNYLHHHCDEHIKNLVAFEKQDFNSSNFKKEKNDFNKTYKILEPMLSSLFENTSYNTLHRYKFELSSSCNKVKDAREKKEFLPAGMCYFGEKLFINTSQISRKSIRSQEFRNQRMLGIFLHELGHAIDYPLEISPILKYNSPIECKEDVSSCEDFSLQVMKNYKNSKKLRRVVRKEMNYYVKPENIYIDLENETFRNGALLYRDWDRPQQESWAESFAILSRWFWYGFNRLDTVMIEAKSSIDRTTIKTLMPTITYMLENLNWEYLGLSNELYKKRKILIKKLLIKLDKTPLIKKEATLTFKQSKQLKSVKKLSVRKLIN